jgi:histone deacetylase HOS3
MVCVIDIALSDTTQVTLSIGNGMQSIVWQINEEEYQAKLAAEAGGPPKPGFQVYYGSVHDILSFPCEVTA